MAVSYTHLDVYKRQEVMHALQRSNEFLSHEKHGCIIEVTKYNYILLFTNNKKYEIYGLKYIVILPNFWTGLVFIKVLNEIPAQSTRIQFATENFVHVVS